MNPMNDATERQVQAARPLESTWLSANAGSGKTRVLTDRVARLLLKGVLPQHILCLTYTKAAASEMQNRLFERLGAWAMKSDTDLRKELATLGVSGPYEQDILRDARTLFARAIETPGGLKIQTIHSFCSSILRRFPLEAGVSPMFAEMEERAATLLREDVLDSMAEDTAPEDQDAALVRAMASAFTGESLDTLCREIIGHRMSFEQVADVADILGILDQPVTMSEAALEERVFLGNERDTITALIGALRQGGVNDKKAATKLDAISSLDFGALPALEDVFLTKGGKAPFTAKLGTFPTKAVQSAHVALMPHVEALMKRVEDARQTRLSIMTARRSATLSAFGHRFLQRYEQEKQRRGWLDFDDLILRARNLLNDRAVAEWVLFRLDGGIDHILVDEAQDTSPVQWQVIERLAQEFTSGSGARQDQERTIFVVGDKKQSIYSFQGADPAEFDRMQEEFAARLAPAGKPLNRLGLEYSFRSSAAILRLVDECFAHTTGSSFPQDMKHRAFHNDMPGRVDIWPVVEATPKPEKGVWYKPVDRLGETHHTVVLANQVAESIKQMIDTKQTIPDKLGEDGVYSQRPVQAGDILILVQRRSDLFHEIIRACKTKDLPIAGADRLKVGAELAVRDLAALLAFLATPEDSLALATALKSPLFGWTEQELYDLAHKRKAKFLWQALRERHDDFPNTLAILDDLRRTSDFLRPYDLIERILIRHKGRHELLARLGVEAEDGINALLSQALAYERSNVPSLTGFLVWMDADALEIKRQMDSAGNRIRVMTVHGSKGLEAPVVFLPDTGKRILRNDAQIIDHKGTALWNISADSAPDAIVQARQSKADALLSERLRLLYVAMTRAEKWLIVTAAGDLGKDGQTWYEFIQRGMQALGAQEQMFEGGTGLRYAHGDWSGPTIEQELIQAAPLANLPEHFSRNAEDVEHLPVAVSPSDLGGAKALPGDAGLDEEAAMARGTWIHLLLEHLPEHPPSQWPSMSENLLLGLSNPPNASHIPELVHEATQVLKSTDLAWVFADTTLAEVPITAELGTARLHGIIDRLIVTPDAVTAIDFKTNATVPKTEAHVPEGILRQMGAYSHALKQIYPNHTVKTAILWTKTAQIMPLSHECVTQALQSTPHLDASASHT
nr:double-strand break repair helicase AddA [uncultured Shimia sp.]